MTYPITPYFSVPLPAPLNFFGFYLTEGWSLLYSIYYIFHMRYRSSVHKIEKEQKLVGEHRKQKKGLDVSFPLHPDRFQREQAFENIKHRLHCDLS